jgi:aspartate aminotransferase-like enzyme
MTFGRFFLPGPTEVHPDILAEMNRPVIAHRGPDLSEIIAAAAPRLSALFRTARPVYISTSSATGLMEAGVRNGVRARALALVNGAFSARFRDLVADCGREVESYEVDWGDAHDPAEVEKRLRTGAADSVVLVHSETSTGVLNPLEDIASAVHAAESATGREIMLLVDGVTSVGGALVETDAWGIDWVLTGSQKAMALPPGLAFGAASERMLARAATIPSRGQYFDLLEFDRQARAHQTPNTPAVNLIYALAEQLRRIEAEGVDVRAARHVAMAKRVWAWTEERADRLGISILAPVARRSPTVTAIRMAESTPGSAIAASMRERGFTIAAGYGKLRDSTIRIGHMGDHTVAGLDVLLNELDEVLDG